NASNFNVVSDTQIMATIPAAATTGPITLITPGGVAVSLSLFTVIKLPTITNFLPTSGPVGTGVTITGTNLTGATAVQFNGTNAAFNILSGASITAFVPVGATTGLITVTTPDGRAAGAGLFTVINSPVITGFLPISGSVGTSV